jgi:hypothetical protein
MNVSLAEAHPYALVNQIVAANEPDCILTFSRYKYVAQSPVDAREVFEVPGAIVTREWAQDAVSTLAEGVEIALHPRFA